MQHTYQWLLSYNNTTLWCDMMVLIIKGTWKWPTNQRDFPKKTKRHEPPERFEQAGVRISSRFLHTQSYSRLYNDRPPKERKVTKILKEQREIILFNHIFFYRLGSCNKHAQRTKTIMKRMHIVKGGPLSYQTCSLVLNAKYLTLLCYVTFCTCAVCIIYIRVVKDKNVTCVMVGCEEWEMWQEWNNKAKVN